MLVKMSREALSKLTQTILTHNAVENFTITYDDFPSADYKVRSFIL